MQEFAYHVNKLGLYSKRESLKYFEKNDSIFRSGFTEILWSVEFI